MRFTPEGSYKIDSARIGVRNPYPATCSLFVWDNNQNGLPAVATPKLKMAYAVMIVSEFEWKWQTIALSSPVICSTDFWVGIWIPENSSTRALSDTILNFSSRMAWRNDYGWAIGVTADGDFRIRAFVSYVGAEETGVLPLKLALDKNFPNPVTEKTTISYTIPQATKISLAIYDITGRNVRTLVNEVQSAGEKEVVWDRKNESGRPVSSGIYFYSLNSVQKSITKTMIVL